MSFLSPALTLLEKIITSRTEAPCGVPRINYLEPPGDPGIFGPASVTWRVLSNPASVFIGGGPALLLKRAHPKHPAGGSGGPKFFPDPRSILPLTGGLAVAITVGDTQGAEA